MIRFDVRAQARKHHVSNAHQLAAYAHLTLPVAYRVWSGEPLQRIEVATLEALATAFKCKPWALLDWSDG